MGSDKGLFALVTRGSLIPVRDYLTAKQNYLNMKALVQLDMDSILGTAKALSQQNTNMVADLGVKNLTAQIPAPVKDLLLQEVVTPAQQQLAFIDAQISALVFRVDNNGKPEQITGLNFDASQVAMSTQEKTELQNKVRLL